MAGVKPALAVDLGGLELPVALVAASGCFGTGRELSGLTDFRKLGGVVSRSITAGPRKGAPSPRLAETPAGIVTAVGGQNPGVEAFLEEDLPKLIRTGLSVFVSVAGSSVEEYVRVAALVKRAEGVSALEVYVPCADEARGGEAFTSTPDHAGEVVGAVARLSPVPVFAKLPALGHSLVETARACVRAGAHGLTLIDAVPAMALDISRQTPQRGAVAGVLSGPAIRPLAVRAVFEVARAMPEVPILGVGGVAGPDDAVEMLLAGAWAVQLGTALLVDPAAPTEIAEGILAYLGEEGLASPADLRARGPSALPAREVEAP